jgi:CRISPR-associated endoribonuclease Cas6
LKTEQYDTPHITTQDPPSGRTTASLYSTVVKLIAAREGTIPATQGQLAHGAFFAIVKSVDPALADALHAGNSRKPFTISPLQGVNQAHNGQVRIRRGQEVWLRFTLLSSDLFTIFIRHFLTPSFFQVEGWAGGQTSLPVLYLGQVDFTISEILTTPGSHPWAGHTGPDDLWQAWHAVQPPDLARKITIEFASPTVFSRGSRNGLGKIMDPFPSPAMFFGSLVAMWNEHLPLALDKQTIRSYAEETVVVGEYSMQSRMFRYWKQPQIGAVGKVTYLLKDQRHHELIRALNMLADFAFYSGVGYKTTMGMGQVRRIDGPMGSDGR